MAHFAKLDENNVVTNVVVVNDNVILTNGIENENKGIEFLKSLYGQNTNWKKTSFNTKANVHVSGGVPFRKNYATIGGIYDSEKDAFYSQKPYNSWVLNETTCIWEAPVPCPDSIKNFPNFWNEETQSWSY
jgi:hypothetical protein